MNPILPILGLGALAGLLLSKKSHASVPVLPNAAPAPGAPSTTESIGGHTWKLVRVANTPDSVDVYAPAGSWGPHGELRVLRFAQKAGGARILAGKADGVPEAVFSAAMKDLRISMPAGPTLTTPPGMAPMPESLQQEMIATMMALGVDSGGVVRGPVSAESVRRATELASRLDQAGYKEAGAAMRGYAQQAARMVPNNPNPPAPPVPGVPPALMAQIQRALELERDPAKLAALLAAVKALPPSGERDVLVGTLEALIVQVRSAQAVSQAATEIDQQLKQPSAPSSGGSRLLKLASPMMTGPDVADWQRVLVASGYSNVTPDGKFGPATSAATKDWQKKRALTPDGIVGPATRAKIGTAPTGAVMVPALPSPQPDPKPKTSAEVAAESLATHLLALQVKHGVSGSKGKEDKTLVKRFQSAVGGVADGLTGPNTILALAKNGVGVLPAVMYWGKSATKQKDLPAFRSSLGTIANSVRSKDPVRAAALDASAQRETGQGGLK